MWISMLATEALSTDVETGKQKKKKRERRMIADKTKTQGNR